VPSSIMSTMGRPRSMTNACIEARITPVAAFAARAEPSGEQSPDDKADDQDSHNKSRVRAELQRSEHQLHFDAPVRLKRWPKSYRR
jgi:hypothetical protein